jgi:hypothetical protein
MNNDDLEQYLNRHGILSLLSDAEVARVSTAETAQGLPDGEEYLDLEHLDWGVQRAPGAGTPMGRLLPRKALQEETWGKILRHLAAQSISMPHSGGLVDDSTY